MGCEFTRLTVGTRPKSLWAVHDQSQTLGLPPFWTDSPDRWVRPEWRTGQNRNLFIKSSEPCSVLLTWTSDFERSPHGWGRSESVLQVKQNSILVPGWKTVKKIEFQMLSACSESYPKSYQVLTEVGYRGGMEIYRDVRSIANNRLKGE